MGHKYSKEGYTEAAKYKIMESYNGIQKNCICDFRWLVVLILVLLQFGGIRNKNGTYDVDNSILFIIAIYFLSCGNLC